MGMTARDPSHCLAGKFSSPQIKAQNDMSNVWIVFLPSTCLLYNYSFSGLIRIEHDLWILRSTRTEVTVVEYKMIFEAKYLVTRILQTQLYKICPNSLSIDPFNGTLHYQKILSFPAA